MAETSLEPRNGENLDPVWAKLNHVDADLATVKTDLAKVGAQVEAGFASLQGSLRRLENANDERIRRLENATDASRSPSVWVAAGALIVAIVGAAAAFQAQSIENLRREQAIVSDLESLRQSTVDSRLAISDRRVDQIESKLEQRASLVAQAPVRLDALDASVEFLLRNQIEFGRELAGSVAMVGANRADVERLEHSDVRTRDDADELRSVVSRIGGLVEEIQVRVDAIDNIGSRYRASDNAEAILERLGERK